VVQKITSLETVEQREDR
jgi:hypothetical protein